jgi:hypothetical protein
MDGLASSSECEIRSSIGVQVQIKFTPKGDKDQHAMMKCSLGLKQKDQSSGDKYPYLDRRDNGV